MSKTFGTQITRGVENSLYVWVIMKENTSPHNTTMTTMVIPVEEWDRLTHEVDMALHRDEPTERQRDRNLAEMAQANLSAVEDERDKALARAEKAERERDEARKQADSLADWRCDVTVALGRPQGAFYADVPKLIREVVATLAARDSDFCHLQRLLAAEREAHQRTRAEVARLVNVLHCISLGAQNNMTSKEALGREARNAIAKEPRADEEINKTSEVIEDTKSNLMWASSDNGLYMNWRDANKYVANLNLNGYSDWRLPTIAELRKLYQDGRPWILNEKNPRTGVILTNWWFWSSETRGSEAALVHFSDGDVIWLRQDGSISGRVLPVRSRN